MNTIEIEEKVRSILKRNLVLAKLTDISVEDITNDQNFIEDIGIDSVGIIGLVNDIETEFDLKLGEGELTAENFCCIDKTVTYIKNKIGEQA